jgi:hypothetical protein
VTGEEGEASAKSTSIAIAGGRNSRAKAGPDGAIFLVNRAPDGKIRHVFASKVGDNGIKPDTFYTLNAKGNAVEA